MKDRSTITFSKQKAQTIPSTSVLGVDPKQWLLPETWEFIGGKPNTIETATNSPPVQKPESKSIRSTRIHQICFNHI